MGFKAKVEINGMTGEPYFVITQVEQHKMQGFATVHLRSFESRDKLHLALQNGNKDEQGKPIVTPITDEQFPIPLNESKDLTTGEAYAHIRDNYYNDAVDVIE